MPESVECKNNYWVDTLPHRFLGATVCCFVDTRSMDYTPQFMLVGWQNEVYHVSPRQTRVYRLDSVATEAYIRGIIKQTRKKDPNVAVWCFEIDSDTPLHSQYTARRAAGNFRSKVTRIDVPGANVMGDTVDDLLQALNLPDVPAPQAVAPAPVEPPKEVDQSMLPPYIRGEVALRTAPAYMKSLRRHGT